MVLGRPLERLQEGSEMPITRGAADSEDIRCWNITTKSGDVTD